MRSKMKKLLALVLTLVMAVGMLPSAGAARTGDRTADIRTEFTRPEDVADVIDPEEWVTVIVELDSETTLDVDEFTGEFRQDSVGFSADTSVAAHRANMVDEQTEVQTQIATMVPDVEFRYHYTNLLNGFAAKVQYKDIEAIRSLAGVLDVYMTQSYDYSVGWEEDEEVLDYVSLEEYYETYGGDGIDLSEGSYNEASVFSDQGSVDQMHLQATWDKGYTGAGKVVGVFDSSMRYTHQLFSYMDPEITAEQPGNYKTKENLLAAINANADTINLFDSGWGSWFHQRPDEDTGFSKDVQAAIKNGDFWYNEKVPFAVDYMDGDLEAWDGDSSSHGTHVCGIAAGNPGPLDPEKPVSMDNVNGVLGSAYDAQIMFFKVFSEYDDFGQESDEAVFAALDDAVTLGVNAFNLSLGIPNGFTTMNTYAQAGYQRAYNRAAAAGITISLSAGNDTRDSHPGALVSGYTTLLPNSSKVGFSGSLFAPMTTASAQGTGYSYSTHYDYAVAQFANAAGEAVDKIVDLKVVDVSNPLLTTALTEPSYAVVDCATGSEEDILAASGAEKLEGALSGKIAVVWCPWGYLPYDEGETFAAQQNAYTAGAAAVILCFETYASYFGAGSLWTGDNGETIPVFGGLTKSAGYAPIHNYLAGEDAELHVKFSYAEDTIETARTYSDSGPAGSTSWGVSESLYMKPDIMAPGGNILSAGASSDTALATKSGTSMATPNMEGAFILVQQYVDENLDVFNVKPGTQKYTNLLNQLVASTATVYAPLSGEERLNKYFSPRRQGAGLANIDAATSSKVALRNEVEYNAVTGEAPRTKVELFDGLGDTFSFSFLLDNYNTAARTFDVLSCLQTDATTTSGGRNVLVGSNSNGTDIDPIEDAVMKVSGVTDGATIDTASDNINRYSADAAAAKITVPARSTARVTVTVALNAETMAAYDTVFPNGMFLEGFVFFDSSEEDVNIPFLGFRGDWTQAPIFDMATAYEDLSGMETTDPDYPLFYTTTLNTVNDGSEAVLGGNQYTGDKWPTYNYTSASGVNSIRAYLSALRKSGGLSGDFSAISPNGDGYNEFAYADLALLRNAKALCVLVTDEAGNVVKTIGPEFEYFEALASDGNGTQQVAATYGTKYKRNMEWDGTGDNGKVVGDGQYNYKIIGMLEYEFLKTEGCIPESAGAVTDAYKETVLNALLNSASAQSITMPVKVDTHAPAVMAVLADGTWKVNIFDEGGIQALAIYYDGARVGDVTLVNGTSFKNAYDISELLGNVEVQPEKLELQVVDYAFNRSIVKANEPVSGITVTSASSSVQVGEDVAITVTANGGAYVGAACKLSYENDKFEVKSIPDGWEAKGDNCYSYYNVINSGSYDDGTVLGTFTFTAKKQDEKTTGSFTLSDTYMVDKWEEGWSTDNAVQVPNNGSADVLITLAPTFVCEIVEDYVAGYSLVLAYTNKATGAYTYDGEAMYDVTDAGYLFEGTAYTHVYGLVVSGMDVSAGKIVDTAKPAVKLTYTTDVNSSGKTDLKDAVAVVAVYNANEMYLDAMRMNIVLRADVNKDKTVNVDDFGLVKAEF